MGLDNVWKENADKKGTIAGNFKVCGGICSDNGNNSFRGKVYNSIIQEITGISLYEEKIDIDLIKQMNEKIQDCEYDKAKTFSFYELEKKEWSDFQKMWASHAEAGHYLISWW